jgi:hypothetical protein
MIDDARYTDLGVDSVMAISIFSIVRRDIGLDLPASFLMDNETVGKSKKALKSFLQTEGEMQTLEGTDADMSELESVILQESKSSFSSSPYFLTPPSSMTSRSISPARDGDNAETMAAQVQSTQNASRVQKQAAYISKAICYHAARSSDSDKLFFVADETGSTFGYIQLPSLGPDLGVYGIDSPFAKIAADIDVDVKQLASIYQAAIQKEQPSGPYMLGGISAGAVLAFEVARGLLEAGQEVRNLLILDCVSPRVQDTTANHLNGTYASLRGYMKSGQVEHIKNTLSIFATYHPAPLTPLRQPAATLQILASDKLGSKPDYSNNLKWLDIIPGLQTLEINIPSGSFLKIPMVSFHESARST